ncbi:MAG: hypothetical protein HY815_09350 [Candidatus Riflebacteria bacterium]|nr:hypothetical protein [Candidatus Riflebacteria bacterium]
MPYRTATNRRGDTLYILFTVLVVLFILAMSLGWVYRQQVTWLSHYGPRLQVYYVALAGLDRTVDRIRGLLQSPLVLNTDSPRKEEHRINQDLLNLLDPERAKEWARLFEFKDGEIIQGGQVKVLAELLDVSKNEFFSFIDRVEKIPPGLEQYREKRDDEDNPVLGAQPLGGWSGRLKLTATATYQGHRCVVEVVKHMKVIDLSPPAPDHTLFIHSKKTEYLKDGTFVLSNLTLPQQGLDLIHELTLKVNEVLRIAEISDSKAAVLQNVDLITKKLVMAEQEGDSGETLKMVYELTQHVGAAGGDERIKDTVDNIILSLNPRDWGRVRTNGVLQVYLPFFAPDDIINYFADSSVFGHQRPEVGYHNNFNRLHDPYLSVYTHYEGYVYRNYRRLNPVMLGPSKTPQVVPPQRYTINTRMNYVLRYPEREAVPNLSRLENYSIKYASQVFRKPVSFYGSKDNPIQLDGIWHGVEEIRIGGFFKGRGMIVSEKAIILTDSLKHASAKDEDLLSLVSLRGSVDLGQGSGQTVVEAGIYAKESVRGTRYNGIKVLGNMVCENLNRDQMPRVFECRFDPRLKNHLADNIQGSISRRLLSFRILGDEANPKSRRGSL